MILNFNLKNIIDSLISLDDQTKDLLVKQGLYKTYIKNLIVEEFCSSVLCNEEDIEKSFNTFLKNNSIVSKDELKNYLEKEGISESNLKKKISITLKINEIISKNFEKEALKYYEKNFKIFELYTYSILREKDKNISNQIFKKLKSGKDNFQDTYNQFSKINSNENIGTIGPKYLKNIHPIIADKIEKIKIGEIIPPFQIDNYWIIVKLENKFKTNFDSKKKKEFADKLFDEWLDKESSKIIIELQTKSNSKIENKNNLSSINPRKNSEIINDEIVYCLELISEKKGIEFNKNYLRNFLENNIDPKADIKDISELASKIGFQTNLKKIDQNSIINLISNVIIPFKGGFGVITRSTQNFIQINTMKEGIFKINKDEIKNLFPNEIEILSLEAISKIKNNENGIRWFWEIISKYKIGIIQVLISGFIVQFLTLANPLLVQVIIDKVISQRSLDTLQVLGIALLAVTIFEGILNSLKTFLFSEITNRIDLRIGTKLIDHLLRLPLAYFNNRSVGELSTRIGELERIRSFLTGQALTALLDSIFSIIYIVVMLLYSWILTLLSLIVIPIQIIITVLGTPIFRNQYRKAAIQNAQNQSFLNEILTGIETVKTQNIENLSRTKWQNNYSKYIKTSFKKLVSGTTINQSSIVLQKISQLIILWVGSILVLRGQLSLGQLIAFRIISGYVTQPLLRLSTIWQKIQELKVSLERLSDILKTQGESISIETNLIILPKIKGNIAFKDVHFGFDNSKENLIKNINFEVKQGELVGIVGKSGSGKSLLIKLISRLYTATNGYIYIDGYDILKVDLYSLRKQIGIIPQEPLLFSGSILDNLTLNNKNAKNDEIIQAAKLAEAHNFIMELPNGYGTIISERGSNLSGGQRQRIAIARTILMNPNMLILDEATSALDYQTEQKVCINIKNHFKGKNIFIVTHRLQTVEKADKIFLMEKGFILEQGSHEELIALNGKYNKLYSQKK